MWDKETTTAKATHCQQDVRPAADVVAEAEVVPDAVDAVHGGQDAVTEAGGQALARHTRIRHSADDHPAGDCCALAFAERETDGAACPVLPLTREL